MGDELSGMLDEIRKQTELRRRQADVVAAQAGPVIVEIDDEVTVLEAAGPLRRRGGCSTKRRLDPGGSSGRAHLLRESSSAPSFSPRTFSASDSGCDQVSAPG